MASAKFLEEALNTDVDESAVNALVGSLENQLGTAAVPHTQPQNSILQQNHVNSPISNGGTTVQPQAPQQQQQKHGTMANGDSIITTNNSNSVSSAVDKQMNNAFMNASQPTAITSPYTLQQQQIDQKPPEGVKIVYSQGGQVMGGQQGPAVMQQRPQGQIPNGTIGMSPQTVLGTPNSNISQVPVQKPPTIVLKTNNPGGTPGLVTVPVNAVQQANNGTQGIQTTQIGVSSQQILSNLQVVNVRPQGVQAKGQAARVVLSAAPGLVGARPGTPLTLQSFHGLQPGQQGALLLKTENGQYQLLRVGPAPPTASNLATSQPGAQPMTFRMQTVPAQAVSSAATNAVQAGSGTTTVSSTAPIVQTTQPAQRTANDNTKEKCRKFLANLLELSSREPKSVERNVRTLIQELIDNKVEPEDFCDKLERLLNASPQPCLIGFLKKSLPLLRQSLANNELTIDGIRPPPSNIVFSVTGAAPTVQTVRAAVPPTGAGPGVQQVRIVGPGGSTVVRAPAPGAVLQQRLLGPLRTPGVQQQQARMVTTIRQPVQTQAQTAVQQQQLQQQSISSTQPPALHPVYGAGTPQQLQGAPPNAIVGQHQVQQRVAAPPRTVQVRPGGQTRPPPQRVATAAGGKSLSSAAAGKGAIAVANRSLAKEKEKKSFSAAYTGDDDINDVAAMGGVNLAEETQKILGSTEYVGTQIRSCKEEIMCSMGSLQSKIRQVMSKHGLEDPSNDVAACISHAAQERLRDLVEKLAVITEHRLEIVKSDSRYEVTNDVKGQLKFLEDLDKAERKKHEELEREMLLRAAKSRSKTEDPEQAKLKAKAKEMQRVEMEELRQREANATALQAIGPRKKPRLDGETTTNSQAPTSGPNNAVRGQMPLRQRIKKVTMRDLQFLFESEKDLAKSKLLYKAYLK
ncbi:transcription initiation factor TFIID subunit 4 isoform X2 [Anthonomus grandis grandis]|uniref:transcription initiation factor TFIID subunit 4 isoform X2 n=1 Tax=Anthonomus grandis grandis TaxID=2921223 RepID=UPI0021657E60|nr:transcription initiation factor TFIID subunit 4 isoform X2 [Anthonomus grandis grandis]